MKLTVLTAPWCTQCAPFKATVLSKIQAEHTNLVVEVREVTDADAEKYSIQGVPFLIREDGATYTGTMGLHQLNQWLGA